MILTPEYVSLAIAALGFLASVYYSGKKAKEGNASICANSGLEGDIHKNETT